eukprot:5738572-Pleurochrysis_carterae.AAC.1
MASPPAGGGGRLIMSRAVNASLTRAQPLVIITCLRLMAQCQARQQRDAARAASRLRAARRVRRGASGAGRQIIMTRGKIIIYMSYCA